LHQSYFEIIKRTSSKPEEAEADSEPFDKFYFWGDMLLRDLTKQTNIWSMLTSVQRPQSPKGPLTQFRFLTEEQQAF